MVKLLEYFINNKKVTNLILLFIVITGTISIFNLPRQDNPNVNFNILTISTIYPGASPEDVEINVTDKIEDELEDVDGIEQLSSFSIEHMSFITVQLDPETEDTTQIKADISSAIDRVSDLPTEVEDRPTIIEMKSTDFPVAEIGIMGNETDETIIRRVAKEIESDLKSSVSVGKIIKEGYRKKEVKILTDIHKLAQYHISFNQVINAIKSRNIKSSGGTIESFVDEKKIITFAEFENPLDVSNVIVRSNFSGKQIKISDIAEVKTGYKDKVLITRTNGRNSINLIVRRRGTTDVIDLSEKMPRPDQAPTHTRSSNKLTQMMSAGLPVIAGPLPTYFDIIEQGVNGFIVETPEEWVEAFEALESKETRERIGRAARESVKDKFSLESQVNKLLRVLESI